MTTENKQRALFATRLGVIAATVGSSVGLGNIWRFPYEAGTHGGGAFLVCYVGFILLLGIPVMCAEFVMGRASRSNIFGSFRAFHRSRYWHYVGYIGIIASLMILSFYSVVAGWTMEYCYAALTGAFAPSMQGADFHVRFEGYTSGNWRPLMWTLIFLAINYKVLVGGVTKGIERISNILMPILFVILVAFCVNSMLLPGVREGLTFFFRPDFSAITGSTLIGAMGQAFFSLSIGLGTMMIYASYFKAGTPLVKTAGIIAGLDTLVAVMSAMIIFPAVFSFGMTPEAGPKLVFEVLPAIFTQMPGGTLWAILFFFLLFMASLTSTISMSEISIAFFMEEKGMCRRGATRLNGAIVAVFASLCALSFGCLSGFTVCGLTVFNLFDFVASNILLPLGGMFISIFVGWVLDRRVIRRELVDDAARGASRKVAMAVMHVLVFLLRYVAPVAILAIFLNSIGVF